MNQGPPFLPHPPQTLLQIALRAGQAGLGDVPEAASCTQHATMARVPRLGHVAMCLWTDGNYFSKPAEGQAANHVACGCQRGAGGGNDSLSGQVPGSQGSSPMLANAPLFPKRTYCSLLGFLWHERKSFCMKKKVLVIHQSQTSN